MEIEKADFPTIVNGQITRVAPTEKGHIYSEGQVFIRGVDWRWSLHLHLWSDGKWHVGIENDRPWNQKAALHGSRPDSFDGFTDAAYNKAKELIVPAVVAWAEAHHCEMQKAEDEHIERALGQRLEQIEAHQNAIDVLQMELEELRKGKHLNTYSKVKSYYFSVEQ